MLFSVDKIGTIFNSELLIEKRIMQGPRFVFIHINIEVQQRCRAMHVDNQTRIILFLQCSGHGIKGQQKGTLVFIK